MVEKKTSTKKVAKKVAPKKSSTKKIVVKKKTTTKKTVNKKPTKAKKTIIKKSVVKKVAAKKVTKSVTNKVNSAKFSSEMGLFSRFWRVFTPTFLSKLGAQKSQGTSWGFWFLSNFVLLLIPVIAFFIFKGYFFAGFPDNLVEKIPSNEQIKFSNGETYNVKNLVRNFELTMDEDGKLSTKNLPDPLIFITNEGEDEGSFYTNLEDVPVDYTEFAFILDTKGVLDIKNSDKKFGSYFYFLGEEAVIFDGQKNKLQTIIYKEMIAEGDISEFPKTFGYQDFEKAKPALVKVLTGIITVMAIFFYLFLAIFRLLMALFWALIFWPIGAIFGLKKWDFENSFMGMLHFGFITMLLSPLVFILDLPTFWYFFVILFIFFGMNFWEMKNKK